jgi:DNA-binding NtrC family response regulator
VFCAGERGGRTKAEAKRVEIMEDLLLVPSGGRAVIPPAPPLVPGNAKRIHALLMDDERELLQHTESMLLRESCRVSSFSSVHEAIGELQRGLRPNVAFISSRMPGKHGAPALAWFHQVSPTIPTIAMSCSHDPRSIVEAMKLGAVDVLIQPFDRGELKSSLAQWVHSPVAGEETQVREITLSANNSFVFSSPRMKAVAAQCATIARVDLPILILGESGTGKEVLAQYIHKMSCCASRTFLKVNCAAMPADLLESELLGYEQGAFTGATKSKPGKFELCDHGTIFLDEIGEMPPGLQAKLLQVLQDGTFSRLGGRTTIKVDVRVIAATNIDIKAAIAQRRFREDLYYRLNGFSLCLPPLRERKEEIPVLIHYFMQRMADKYARAPLSFSTELMGACMRHPWPGNLRELENFVKRYLVLGDEQAMLSELSRDDGHLLSSVDPSKLTSPSGGLKKLVSNLKGEAEAEVIATVLQRNQWKRKQTAAELKISYKALLYKIRQYGIVESHGESLC